MCVRVLLSTGVIQHFAIAALAPAYEQDEVVAPCKFADVRHAVGNGTAYSIKRLEYGSLLNMLFAVFYYLVELAQRLRGLGIEVDVM